MKFSIIIPLFNENENIANLVDEIKTALLDKKYIFEIILIDDASTDDTYKTITFLKKTNQNILILQNNINLGQSFSLIRGINSASHDIIVTIDGDGQNNPVDIPKLLNIFNSEKQLSLVGGIRKNRKDSYLKILSSKIANTIRKFVLKDNCNDTGCSLKVFDKIFFLQFPQFMGLHRFLPALFISYGGKTTFCEVDHRARIHGKSKYGTLIRLINGVIDMIKVFFIIRKNKNKNKNHYV
jgi:dolichol-phosphate mannosyltransferase